MIFMARWAICSGLLFLFIPHALTRHDEHKLWISIWNTGEHILDVSLSFQTISAGNTTLQAMHGSRWQTYAWCNHAIRQGYHWKIGSFLLLSSLQTDFWQTSEQRTRRISPTLSGIEIPGRNSWFSGTIPEIVQGPLNLIGDAQYVNNSNWGYFTAISPFELTGYYRTCIGGAISPLVCQTPEFSYTYTYSSCQWLRLILRKLEWVSLKTSGSKSRSWS